MKNSAQVVVIGGGVVGCSVLYHLTKKGWSDVVLVERSELTSGSTWHAAGGMHTLNNDPVVAKLQKYTIDLYQEIQEISGQDCGVHRSGGYMLADTDQRVDVLKQLRGQGQPGSGKRSFWRHRLGRGSAGIQPGAFRALPMPRKRKRWN